MNSLFVLDIILSVAVEHDNMRYLQTFDKTFDTAQQTKVRVNN